jgi:putative transposase
MKTKNQIHKIYLRRREAASQVQYEYLTETHYIRPSHKAYPRLVKAAHAANNLYNSGLYILRQSLIHEGKFLNYNAIDKILKQQRNQKQNMVYDQPGHASTSQQILMIVGQNWNSWLKALKAYRKDPKKFTGRPKMPIQNQYNKI